MTEEIISTTRKKRLIVIFQIIAILLSCAVFLWIMLRIQKNNEARQNLFFPGMAKYHDGMYVSAIQDFHKYLREAPSDFPTNADASYYLGMSYFHLNDLQDARIAFLLSRKEVADGESSTKGSSNFDYERYLRAKKATDRIDKLQ